MGFFKRIFNTNGLKRTVKRATNLNGLKRNIGKIGTVVGGVIAATGIGAPLGGLIAGAANAVSGVVNTVGQVLGAAGDSQIKSGQDTKAAAAAVQNTTGEGYKDNVVKPLLIAGGVGLGAYMLLGKKKSRRR